MVEKYCTVYILHLNFKSTVIFGSCKKLIKIFKDGPKAAAEVAEAAKTRTQSSLLRLFESKHFDPAMAINYLFVTKEPGVLEYIGNRLFRKKPYIGHDFFLSLLFLRGHA